MVEFDLLDSLAPEIGQSECSFGPPAGGTKGSSQSEASPVGSLKAEQREAERLEYPYLCPRSAAGVVILACLRIGGTSLYRLGRKKYSAGTPAMRISIGWDGGIRGRKIFSIR